MSVTQVGSNVVVNGSVAGSVFPTSERDMVFPVLVDGTTNPVRIDGALYGRAIELSGNVRICGPIAARGDVRLNPKGGRIEIVAGITINGTLNGVKDGSERGHSIQQNVENASVIIKGDIAVNQNIALNNTIVFGNLRAVNCSLENCLVLGSCIVTESLKVSMSSIGGYAARDVTFIGHCVMLHALGESRGQPLFVPYEKTNGEILGCDIRYYPAIRGSNSFINRLDSATESYPEYARLFPELDWVAIEASANSALDEEGDGPLKKWVLSIGGRIGDISKISQAMIGLTQMLKCGFEYEHYHVGHRDKLLKRALTGLTQEEQWILKAVCQ